MLVISSYTISSFSGHSEQAMRSHTIKNTSTPAGQDGVTHTPVPGFRVWLFGGTAPKANVMDCMWLTSATLRGQSDFSLTLFT